MPEGGLLRHPYEGVSSNTSVDSQPITCTRVASVGTLSCSSQRADAYFGQRDVVLTGPPRPWKTNAQRTQS